MSEYTAPLVDEEACPNCGAQTVVLGSAWTETDVSWPHCTECDWQGEP